LRAGSLEGIEVVAQPERQAASTSSVSHKAPFAGGGNPCSFVHAILAQLLILSSFPVGLRNSSGGVGSFQ
jgi:hypothetical protein